MDADAKLRDLVRQALELIRATGREAILREFDFDRARRYALAYGSELFDPEAVLNLALGLLHDRRPQPHQHGGLSELEARAQLVRLGFEVLAADVLPLAGTLMQTDFAVVSLDASLAEARAALPPAAVLLIQAVPGRLPDYAASLGELTQLAARRPGDQPLRGLREAFAVPAWVQPEHSLLDLWRLAQTEPGLRLFVVGDAEREPVLGVAQAALVTSRVERLRQVIRFLAESRLSAEVFAAPQSSAATRYACAGPPAHHAPRSEIQYDPNGSPRCKEHGRPAPASPA
ncbi:MAG: hypothetical protein IT318_18480 [Anaerolineales bacterium]|nr:hypothetical protein [Anaerolineales bacterium]